MLDIHALMKGLADERPVFHNEADFQFALAWHIREETGEPVRLEWRPFRDEKMYLDLWLPRANVAVELKYVTRRLDVSCEGEWFSLQNHAAQPRRRYDFLRDLMRLESVVSSLPAAWRGIAVLLTNDSAYWNPPSERRPVDSDFRVHERDLSGSPRYLSGTMEWAEHTGIKTKEGKNAPIVLDGSYEIVWRDYANLLEGARRRFRYLAIEVSPDSAGAPAGESPKNRPGSAPSP